MILVALWLATKFSPLGVTMGGVERWLRVGPIPLQVSEIAKFALIGAPLRLTAAADGRTVTEQTSFTTMAAPAERTGTGLYLFDGQQYGVAMPVVVLKSKLNLM